MALPKKILILGFVFVALAAAAGYIYVKGKSAASPKEPLAGVETKSIRRIAIQRPNESFAVDQRNERWFLTSPIEDAVAPPIIDQVVRRLQGFAIGSPVSENKSKFDQFEIGEGKATRVQVFVFDREEPALDGFIGKQAGNFNDSYFRFAGRDAVYIAKNLPTFVMQLSMDEFRQKQVTPADMDRTMSIEIKNGKETFLVVRTTDAWSLAGSSVVISRAWMEGLMEKFDRLYADRFLDDGVDGKDLGFAAPYAEFTIGGSMVTETVIGNKLPVDPLKMGVFRYAQTKDRRAVMVVNQAGLDDIFSYLKTVPR